MLSGLCCDFVYKSTFRLLLCDHLIVHSFIYFYKFYFVPSMWQPLHLLKKDEYYIDFSCEGPTVWVDDRNYLNYKQQS